MAEIGDKSFTTELVQEIKAAVLAELGSNAYVKRHLATVTSVNTTTSEVVVRLSGLDSDSIGFYARGLQLPAVGDSVIACIDGQDRWIESVVRPATSTPYLQISGGALVGGGVPTGAIVAWSMVTPPSGWLVCNGTTVSRTTYAGLFAVIGTSFGAGDGSSTFGLPNLQGRFLGAQAAHTTQPAVNGGNLGPNSSWSAASHNHTVALDHSHANNFAVSGNFSGGNHTHGVSGSSGSAGGGATGGVNTAATGTAASGNNLNVFGVNHTHNGPSHTHGAGNYGADSAACAGNVSVSITGGVTSVSSSSVTSGNATPSIGTPSSFLANFIIKT